MAAVRVAVIAAVAAPIVLAGAQAAEASWVVQHVPEPAHPQGAGLEDVSCPSPTSCVVLGGVTNSLNSADTADVWNGTSWTLLPKPPEKNNFLTALSCTSATACTFVGRSFRPSSQVWAAMVTQWNGTSWTVQNLAVPSFGGSILTDVSCPSTTACVAVGSAGDPSIPLAEVWNGTSWTEDDGVSAPGRQDTYFDGVSCTSHTSCMAVGLALPSYLPITESWNGHDWTMLQTPLPAGGTEGEMESVSCSSATVCVAVGDYNDGSSNQPNKALAEIWNGTSWTVQTLPRLGDEPINFLSSVSCARSGPCTAVGSTIGAGQHQRAMAEHWNGTRWSRQTVVIPAATHHSALSGVSCPVKNVCTAVGGYSFESGGGGHTLAEQDS